MVANNASYPFKMHVFVTSKVVTTKSRA